MNSESSASERKRPRGRIGAGQPALQALRVGYADATAAVLLWENELQVTALAQVFEGLREEPVLGVVLSSARSEAGEKVVGQELGS